MVESSIFMHSTAGDFGSGPLRKKQRVFAPLCLFAFAPANSYVRFEAPTLATADARLDQRRSAKYRTRLWRNRRDGRRQTAKDSAMQLGITRFFAQRGTSDQATKEILSHRLLDLGGLDLPRIQILETLLPELFIRPLSNGR